MATKAEKIRLKEVHETLMDLRDSIEEITGGTCNPLDDCIDSIYEIYSGNKAE